MMTNASATGAGLLALSIITVATLASPVAPRATSAQALTYRVPAEPVAPTDIQQCHQLRQGYDAIARAIRMTITQVKGPVTVEPTPACGSPRNTVVKGTGTLLNQACMARRQGDEAVARCRAEVAANQASEKLAARAGEEAARELARRKGYGSDVNAVDDFRRSWAKWKGRYETAEDIGNLASGQASWREQYDIVGRAAQKTADSMPFNPVAKAIIGESLKQTVMALGGTADLVSDLGKQVDGFNVDTVGSKASFGSVLANVSRDYQAEVERQQRLESERERRQLAAERERQRLAEVERRREEDERQRRRAIARQIEREEAELQRWRRENVFDSEPTYNNPLDGLMEGMLMGLKGAVAAQQGRGGTTSPSASGSGDDWCAALNRRRGQTAC